MPHYADGTLATAGDLVITATETPSTPTVLGILLNIQPGATTCNCQVQTLARKYGTGQWVKIDGMQYPECLTVAQLRPAGAIALISSIVEVPAY